MPNVQAMDIMSLVARDTDPPRLPEISYADHVIQGALDLDGVEITGSVDFQGAVFEGRASFVGAIFTQDVGFNEATFARGVTFQKAQFLDIALFQRITVGPQGATFRDTQFESLALFANAEFQGETSFADASFALSGSFGHTTFASDVDFDRVHGMRMDLARCRFQSGAASFVKFAAANLQLTRAMFTAPLDAELTVPDITLAGAVFAAGASIRCTSPAGGTPARITLDGSRFGASSLITGSGSTLPLLESMRFADASNLTLSNLALEHCRFRGAHNLDQLRLEGSAAFAESPAAWRFELPWPWWQRWTHRRVLAEEIAWRVQQPARERAHKEVRRRLALRRPGRVPMRWPLWQYTGKPADRMRWPEWGATPEEPDASLDPGDVATLYRALRKGREDHKDEPGAADFYYGEMEMRRWGAQRRNESLLDRIVLWAYWLISGYALRASRAATTLLVVILAFAVLFHTIGFASTALVPRAVAVQGGRIVYATATLPRRGPVDQFSRAVTYSAATASALADPPARRLTPAGDALRIMLRVLGPVLLALTALSIRGRIKR